MRFKFVQSNFMKNESSTLISEGPHVGSGIILGQIEKMLRQFSIDDYILPINLIFEQF